MIKNIGSYSVDIRLGTSDGGTYEDVMAGWSRPPVGLDIKRALDLGAYTGITVLDLADLYPDAEICAVELEPQNYQLMVANTKQLGERCIKINAAVVDQPCSEKIGCEFTGHANGHHVGGSNLIDAITILEIMEYCKWDSVDFVKMDIEGMEVEVINNCFEWNDRIKCINIEYHDYSQMEIGIEHLKDAGYNIVYTQHPHNLGLIAQHNVDYIRNA